MVSLSTVFAVAMYAKMLEREREKVYGLEEGQKEGFM